eukprot:COSAG01_NODE_3468_length_6048_cov_100.676357_3_plen_86_part_00
MLETPRATHQQRGRPTAAAAEPRQAAAAIRLFGAFGSWGRHAPSARGASEQQPAGVQASIGTPYLSVASFQSLKKSLPMYGFTWL